MTSSFVTDFNPSIDDIIEEAYDRLGQSLSGGYQLRKAKRSLNYVLTHMANRGLNTFTLEERTLPLVQAQASYNLEADIVDIAEATVRNANDRDIQLHRMSLPEYTSISTKDTSALPSRYYLYRQSSPRLVLWPVPDLSTYTLYYYVWRRLHDAGGFDNTADVPFRYYDVLASGLAYRLAMKQPTLDANRIKMLKADYDETLNQAEAEDRDRSTMTVYPGLDSYTRV